MPDVVAQFLLFTVGGALLTFIWNSLRDEESRRQAVLISLRDLAAQVDEHYRATKQLKRMIRSRQKAVPQGYEIDASFFEARMDALSNVQLKIEVARNAIRSLPDIIGPSRRKRIVKYLGYSADYLHAVVEEFEKRCVVRETDVFRIGPDCVNLQDFLGPRWEPENCPGELRTAWNAFMEGELWSSSELPPDEEVSPSQALTYSARFEAFKTVTTHDFVKALSRKTKSISDECMLQAIREFREEITMNQPLISLARFRRWPSAT